MLRVGLTGGIACGKSEVVRRLSAAGLPTLDLDRVGHEVMAPGEPGYVAVVEAFGPSILGPDGSIDRRALGTLVFADPAARQRLNQVLHPRIRAEEDRRARQLGDGPGTSLITDAALLVETGMHLRFDRLVVVHCRPDQQMARLRARDGLTEEEARARLAAQMPVATKVRFAHMALDASRAVEDTHRTADALAVELAHLARHRPEPIVIAEERARRLFVHGSVKGPRGLTPALVSEGIAATGGVDLGSLAASLRPRADGPWYEAAETAQGNGRGPSPAALVGPLVLHELREHGLDSERLAAAAFSLAWLTDREGSRLASSVLYTLLLAEVLALGRVPPDLDSRAAGLEPLARRWAGSGPDPGLGIVVRAALAHPRDVDAARAFCASQGGDAGLVGGLVGSVVSLS